MPENPSAPKGQPLPTPKTLAPARERGGDGGAGKRHYNRQVTATMMA